MSHFISETCPGCGAGEIDENLKCNYCGSQLRREEEKLIIAAAGFRCPVCHRDNLEKNDFCQQCGEKLKKKCPFCLEMHHVTAIFCPRSGYNIKEMEDKKKALEEKRRGSPERKKPRVDVQKILDKTIEKEKWGN